MISIELVAPVRRSSLDPASKSILDRVDKVVTAVYRNEKKQISANQVVAIQIVGRSRMRNLHRSFMDDPTDTDVLSFPSDGGGDIAICLPVAKENAKRFHETPARELLRLIVHGTLHLLGYKDDPLRQQKRMWKVQESLVAKLWTR